MAAQKGKDILLRISDGASSPTYTAVAGLRARTISLNAKAVDATDGDSAGWRELIASASTRQISVSGSGVFRDASADGQIRQAFFDGAAHDWQLVIPSFGTLQGPFQVSALEYAGQYDGEATFALTLSSAGAVSFTGA